MNKRKLNMAAALIGSMTLSTVGFAADSVEQTDQRKSVTNSDAQQKMAMKSKDELEQALGVGKDKAHYRKTLEDMGYAITAVNDDESDYLEYEIIKNGESYELQVDFENGVATEVDVTANLWMADATEKALEDKNYRYVYPTVVGADINRVSDRERTMEWDGEKGRLERRLGVGHEASYYKPALEKMGYKVTSVNEHDEDTIEMEVVKDNTSYEVEIELDEKSKKSTAVDVSLNMWENSATEQVKDGKSDQMKDHKSDRDMARVEPEKLEKALGLGKDKAHYRQTLEKMGYAITSVNADESDYLEYEVIKNGETYEVQVDFENGMADEIDVTTNVWLAESTERALGDMDYKYSYPSYVAENSERFSDRARLYAWGGEKTRLEQQLGVDRERSYYRPALEKMGYQVTSVNDNDEATLELEVVKADTSYEVEVEFDENTKRSSSVDISTNMWETDATERVKDEK